MEALSKLEDLETFSLTFGTVQKIPTNPESGFFFNFLSNLKNLKTFSLKTYRSHSPLFLDHIAKSLLPIKSSIEALSLNLVTSGLSSNSIRNFISNIKDLKLKQFRLSGTSLAFEGAVFEDLGAIIGNDSL